MTATEYLSEPVVWGGIPTTRFEIMREMLDQGFSRGEVEFFLIGFDRFCELQATGEQA